MRKMVYERQGGFLMYLSNEKKHIVEGYLLEKIQNIHSDDECYDLVRALGKFVSCNFLTYNKKCNELKAKFWAEERASIQELFSDINGKAYKALLLLLDKSSADYFIQLWNRSVLYSYVLESPAKPFRSLRSSYVYFKKNMGKLIQWFYLTAKEFSLLHYLEGSTEAFENLPVISDMIAYETDKGNQEIISRIEDIIYHNNQAVVTKEIIQGLLKSTNEKAHKMLADLLMAANLQEGLRQTIVNCMAEASKEAFLYILKWIIDHQLTRFSSIAKGFNIWTGLSLDMNDSQRVEKAFKALYDCLSDSQKVMDYIQDEDEFYIYIGLWAAAFNETADLAPLVMELIEKEEKNKNLVALYFLGQNSFSILKHQMACKLLRKNDYEILAWAINSLYSFNCYYDIYFDNDIRLDLEGFKLYKHLNDGFKEKELFELLKQILETFPQKKLVFNSSLFSGILVELTDSEILNKMMYSILSEHEKEQVDYLITQRKKMSPEGRVFFIENFLAHSKEPVHKKVLLEACTDRSEWVSNKAFELVNGLNLEAEDYKVIEGFLKYKSGYIRKKMILLLLKQNDQALLACIKGLFQSGEEGKHSAAREMLSLLKKDTNRQTLYNECAAWMDENHEPDLEKERSLKEKIKNEDINLASKKGFGLYDPTKELEIPLIAADENNDYKALFSAVLNKMISVLQAFSEEITMHRNDMYEFIDFDGTKKRVVLGESSRLLPYYAGKRELDAFPLAEEMRNLKDKLALNANELIVLNFYLRMFLASRFEEYDSWYLNLLNDYFQANLFKSLKEQISKISYLSLIHSYIDLLVREIPKSEGFGMAKNFAAYLLKKIPLEQHQKEYTRKSLSDFALPANIKLFRKERFLAMSPEINYWLFLIKDFIYDDKSFEEYFWIVYSYYKYGKYSDRLSLFLDDFVQAFEKGLIDENEICKEFLERRTAPDNISEFTNPILLRHRAWSEAFINIGNKVVETIVNIEIHRGEMHTPVSHLAAKIQRCYGLEIMVSILLNLEKNAFVRGYNFLIGDFTRKQILSHLLKVCYPKKEDTKEKLESLLKGKKVSDKRLIEIGMYAPQWLDLISHYLNMPDLKSACWYFHAHVNSIFLGEKQAFISRYSSIPIEDLKDGAFDFDWFKEVYTGLGEKNFKLVYDSAKYVAAGNLHRRSQLFADAYLGKLSYEEAEKKIKESRNKDYLLCLGLIPVKDKEDLLRRYELMNQFKEEAKKFGAQRQASEKRCAEVALLNLARNAGFPDANRLTWNMETEKMNAVKTYMNPYSLEDLKLWLEIDENGQSQICCTKNGKALKNIPVRLKKDEYVEELKAVHDSLRKQFQRVRQHFEEVMVKEEDLEAAELINLSKNPVIAPIIRHLVFLHDDQLGYFMDGNLVNDKGEVYILQEKDKVKIAHPVHFKKLNRWAEYQKDLFEKKIKQPFKQVFRELYLPYEDELGEKSSSYRYAAYPIQRQKALALLQASGWIMAYEQILQKVFYNEIHYRD